MGGEEDCAAPVAQFPHHALEQMRGLGIQPHEGFVHEDQLGFVNPCGNNGQLLLHAVGISRDGLPQIAGQLEKLGVLPNAFLPNVRLYSENVRDEVQILDARHELIQVGVIGDIGHLPLAAERVGLNGHTADENLAFVKGLNARHGFQRGSLARAIVADEAVDFARSDMQTQIVHRFFVAIGLGEMLNLKHCFSPCLHRIFSFP